MPESFVSNALLTGDGKRINTPAALPTASRLLQVNADGTSEAAAPGFAGEEVNQSLRLKLQKITQGTETSVNMLVVGDSLGTGLWNTPDVQLESIFAGYLPNEEYYSQHGPRKGGITVQRSTDSTESYVAKTDFDVSWSGTSHTFATGEFAKFGLGNTLIWADRVRIPVVTEPGAGKIRIQVSDGGVTVTGATFRDLLADEIVSDHTLTTGELIVDADDTFGLDVVELSIDLAMYAIRIDHESDGDVRILPPQFAVVGDGAVNIYRMAEGGHFLRNVDETANSLVATLIDAFEIDLIMVQTDDAPIDYEHFLPILSDCLDSATLSPTVVLVGNPGITDANGGGGVSEADLPVRIQYCKDYGKPKRWDVLDGYEMVGGFTEVERLGLAADGIHLNGNVWKLITERWAKERGLYNWRSEIPGGTAASNEDVLTKTSSRFVTAENVHLITGQATTIETASMDWGFNLAVQGTGSIQSGLIYLSCGGAANSEVTAYVDRLNTPIGQDQGKRSLAMSQSFSTAIRSFRTPIADGVFWITAQNRTYNGGFYGALTSHGWGWRLAGAALQGTYYSSGAQYTETLTITTGSAAPWYYLQIVSTPTGSASTNRLDFYVNNTLLDSVTHSASGTVTPARFELTNGATGGPIQVEATPPRYT